MSEIMPYIETDLTSELDNKQEIDRRSSNGITVIAYWHKAENQVSIYLHDARTEQFTEFFVPNDEVAEWFEHPYANPQAVMPTYRQGANGV